MNNFLSPFWIPPPPPEKQKNPRDPDSEASKSTFHVFNTLLQNTEPEFQNLNLDLPIGKVSITSVARTLTLWLARLARLAPCLACLASYLACIAHIFSSPEPRILWLRMTRGALLSFSHARKGRALGSRLSNVQFEISIQTFDCNIQSKCLVRTFHSIKQSRNSIRTVDFKIR